MQDDLRQLLQTLTEFSQQSETFGLRPDKARQLQALARSLCAILDEGGGQPAADAAAPEQARASAPPQPAAEKASVCAADDGESADGGEPLRAILGLEKAIALVLKESEVTDRIMLASGDPRAQEEMVETLAANGIMADMVVTCDEARTRLGERAYAALVFDLSLPDFDSAEMMKHCRTSAGGAEVMVAAPADALGGVLEAMEHGASDYLVSPIPSRPYLTWKIRGALTRHRFQMQSQIVIQFLATNLEKMAVEKGLDPQQACAAELQSALEAYRKSPGPTSLAVLGPLPLVRSARGLGHETLHVDDVGALTELLRTKDVQVVVAVDDEQSVDSVEVITRVRRVNPEIGLFVVAPERKLEALVRAIDTGTGDYLLRPMEGRELFAPRLRHLIARQGRLQRFNQLIRELKALSLSILKARPA